MTEYGLPQNTKSLPQFDTIGAHVKVAYKLTQSGVKCYHCWVCDQEWSSAVPETCPVKDWSEVHGDNR
jgi:hypothetical protein